MRTLSPPPYQLRPTLGNKTMISLRQLKINKIKEFLIEALNFAASHLFFALLFLIFLSLILGASVFYKYSILSQKIEPESVVGAIKFRTDIYQKILDEWQNREEEFKAAKTRQYPDPFKPSP